MSFTAKNVSLDAINHAFVQCHRKGRLLENYHEETRRWVRLEKLSDIFHNYAVILFLVNESGPNCSDNTFFI